MQSGFPTPGRGPAPIVASDTASDRRGGSVPPPGLDSARARPYPVVHCLRPKQRPSRSRLHAAAMHRVPHTACRPSRPTQRPCRTPPRRMREAHAVAFGRSAVFGYSAFDKGRFEIRADSSIDLRHPWHLEVCSARRSRLFRQAVCLSAVRSGRIRTTCLVAPWARRQARFAPAVPRPGGAGPE